MQLRPLMLVCVAIVSGVMSAVHLYLVSSRRQNFISVALEIPVQRVQGSTNLELNIHSLGDAVGDVERNTEAETADHSRRTEADVNEQVAAIPLRHSLGEAGEEVWGGLGRDDGEEYVLFDDKEEEYEAMLDTGEYELKEKDMDEEEKEEEGEPSLPPTTQRHRRYRHQKRRQKDRMRPAVVTGSQTSPVAETQQKLRGSVADVEAEGAVVRAVVGDTAVEVPRNDQGGGPYVISKEEYYMRQATSTYHPPTTHTPHHHTHRNTSHTSYQCSQPPCLQFLSSEERLIFNKCQRRTGKTLEPPPACKCRFRRGVGKKRVAVVSVPGSGNTWMRGLLEKASGLCTGSIYCDRSLRNGGFCGEGLRGSSLLAVKTHDSCLQWRGGSKTDPSRPVFDKAIFLIRDPFKTNVAEWNRRVSRKYASDQTGSTHVKYVSNEALFGKYAGWQVMVKYLTHKWRLMLGCNLKALAAGKPVLPVFFEEVKKDPAPQLERMMEFLELPVSPAVVNATVMDGFTSYYRNHTDNFDHYTAEQRLFVNTVIASTADAHKEKALDIAKRLREYMHHESL